MRTHARNAGSTFAISALPRLPRACAIAVLGLLGLALTGWQPQAGAQSAPPQFEYLMTYEAELEPPQVINEKLLIVNVKPGGWARGPKLEGSFIPPGGDWLRILPSGVSLLDVRATLKTNDGALIYLTYNGIVQHSKESFDKLVKGEVIRPSDGIYFVTAPTFQTGSEKYAWLNGVQTVAKFVEVRISQERSYVRYDVFIVR